MKHHTSDCTLTNKDALETGRYDCNCEPTPVPPPVGTSGWSELVEELRKQDFENFWAIEKYLFPPIKAFISRIEAESFERGREAFNDCACKEKWTLGVVHQKDTPCYLPSRPLLTKEE